MIVTYNWLKEFVDFDLSPEELSHRLTMAGLEVDAMDKIGEGLDTVIVARLKSVDTHPGADRLTLCQVDTGEETIQVVCGARNHKTGDLVALATVGSVLPGDFKIKKSKIRGEVSMGMLCSEKELGLADESEGILILPQDLPLGTPLFEALGMKDVRYEIGLTPNRPDCLSIVGVAREVSAMVGKPLSLPTPAVKEEGSLIEEETSVSVEKPGLCPRYAARLIKGVKIAPSPDWMVKRLESVGMRSINNVVDVTNYVLLELGHPLHAFDYNLLRGGRIVVKNAAHDSKFKTLDGQTRDLIKDDLVICDAEGPVALAGIMGGENSEIQPDTIDILLESAYFNPPTIRRTSKRLGIHTESSHRFERGCDVNIVPLALDRAASLIHELAGGTVCQGRIDVYPTPVAERRIKIETSHTNEILGLHLETADIARHLRSIGLGVEPVESHPDEALTVSVPTFRPDLERTIDLVEEVARLNGYDNIPVTMPSGRLLCRTPDMRQQTVTKARDLMVANGFSEAINYSFISEKMLDRLGLRVDDERRRTVRILNPLTEEQGVMRTSLVPSLLETASRNLAYRSLDFAFFELRPIYVLRQGEVLPEEKTRLTAVVSGRREPHGWAQAPNPADFFSLKGILESLLEAFRVDGVTWDGSKTEPFLHPGKSCALMRDGVSLGVIGEIHPRTLDQFEIDTPLYLFDLDLDEIRKHSGLLPKFESLSRYPDVYRDSAFLIDDETPAQSVLDVVSSVRAPIIEDFVIFDLYRGKGVPEGKKSLALRVRYRSLEKTLTDDEISKVHEKIIEKLKENLKAEIR